MSRNTYLIVSILVILFGTFTNYSLVGSSSQSSGGRTYIPSGGGFSGGNGGFSGGHK
ncbi:hypothetical protein [Kingella negevensis]|uniref:hypothetical protein n=1 Tax=Kingella negevensis TaxID=1522312 RepID=UPI000A7391DB|nr:hypothetical protein [Kingella negevensis]MDK4688560.1 hypothetical protein [Kingella negevensis]WII91697.1 hypothetical protein QEO93_03700 [Kingella negevensis]